MRKLKKDFSYNEKLKCATFVIRCRENQKETLKDVLSDTVFVNELLKKACKKYNVKYKDVERLRIIIHVKD